MRVDDLYRIGEVNGGWTVMRSALDSEHGIVDPEDHGLQHISAMSAHGSLMAEAVDKAAAIVVAKQDADGRRPLDDESVKYRLGRSFARMEAALSTPGMFGRVAIAQTMRDISPDLMDMLGAASALPTDTSGFRRWRGGGIPFPACLTDRDLRRHPGGVPQHDRPARAQAGAS